jgi:hypothetical protein
MKIIAYAVATGLSCGQVCDEVDLLLKEGYQPLGGIALLLEGGSIVYAQAMVKYQEDPAIS